MSTTTEQLKHLFAEFPKEDVHWRSQSLTKDGSKAMALAYIDARNVMDRLDQIVSSENWQDRYEVHGSRVVCYLSIRVDGEWITKADGAGDTQVEAEKGALSDAFKRAAVKWGIGRYLYDVPTPWVPCESYERNGKRYWKKWTADPWSYVGKQPAKADARPIFDKLQESMRKCKSKADLQEWISDDDVKDLRRQIPADWDDNLKQLAADFGRDLPEGANGYASQTILSGG